MKRFVQCLLYLLLLIAGCNTGLVAQVATVRLKPGELSVEGKFKIGGRLTDLPAPIAVSSPSLSSVRDLLTEDSLEAKKGMPPRFGKSIAVNLGTATAGKWFESDTGRVWKLTLQAIGAYLLNLIFDQFELPPGAQLYLYNGTRDMLIGPIISVVNNPSKIFSSDLLKGSSITLDLFEPKSVVGKTQLHLSKVIFGYKDMFSGEYTGYGHQRVIILM